LSSLGDSIEKGRLAKASSQIDKIIEANPQYQSAGEGSESSSEINAAFDALEKAADSGDQAAADEAWGTIKGLLADSGFEEGSSRRMVDDLFADIQGSLNSYLINALAGVDSTSSSKGSDVTSSLLGIDPKQDDPNRLLDDALSSWMTYQTDQEANKGEKS